MPNLPILLARQREFHRVGSVSRTADTVRYGDQLPLTARRIADKVLPEGASMK